MGCRYPSPPETSPSPNLSAPALAAASLELKAEKQSAHICDVTSVAFSPDGKTIVSGSSDKTIKVWDAGTPVRLIPHLAQNLSAPTLAAASLELKVEKQSAHKDIIWSVAFSPDGKTIVSGSRDKTLKVWRMSPQPNDARRNKKRKWPTTTAQVAGDILQQLKNQRLRDGSQRDISQLEGIAAALNVDRPRATDAVAGMSRQNQGVYTKAGEPLKKKPRGRPPNDDKGKPMKWQGTKEAGRWVRSEANGASEATGQNV